MENFLESASREFAKALQDFDQLIGEAGRFASTLQQGGEHGQSQGSVTQTTEEQPPQTAQAATADVESDILKIISEVVGGEPEPAEQGRIPVDVFRDPAALERFIRENPELGAKVGGFLAQLYSILSSQTQPVQPGQQPQPTAQGQAPSPQPEQFQGPTDAYLSQLQQVKSTIEEEIKNLVNALQAPPQPPEQERGEGDILSSLFGETSARDQQLQQELQRLGILLRLNLFSQLLDRVNDEIARRNFLQTMAGVNALKTLKGLAGEIQNVTKTVTETLDEISARVNKHYGIPDQVGEVIARAVRDELINRGVDIRKIIGRIALEQDQNAREQLVRGFVHEVAKLYGKYAKDFAQYLRQNTKPEGQPQVNIAPPPPPPEPRRESKESSSDRPFANVAREYAQALEQMLKYADTMLPQSLSHRVG